MTACVYCDGECAGADLAPLLTDNLLWLWAAVGKTADRRGDPALTDGTLTVTAPPQPDARSAAIGLLGGVVLRAGQRRKVVLAALTARLRARGAALTPGAVAAHALHRRVAATAIAKRARDELLDAVHDDLHRGLEDLPVHVRDHHVDPAEAWARLRAAGWLARLAAHPHPHRLVAQATAVLAALPMPGQRTDRRTLVASDPHALDDGTPLAALVLALAGQAGRKRRDAWDRLGVDYDDLTGGLLALGIHPTGWSLPADAVVTIPPRELIRSAWPAPPTPHTWVFVTENPSVVTAAAGIATSAPVRLLCTVGTPSRLEAAAVAALADAGWQVAVRADFDPAGLANMRALLSACPAAVPWRMNAADYAQSTPSRDTGTPITVVEADTPWDPALAHAMAAHGTPGYEEALLPELLADLAAGQPRCPA
ncbi:DUF2399 domain-containing protein [Kutzneria kofuensis]|uniref:Uncharacterized protein (TIGR02679 family) n=1 Tax=Kutzneria kofuensis TaxID=103725 RepID=A0A7W9NGE0_9PSEU|nr:DUF2399 domain-containing protein [Kutzneria kofuensis]MBB5891414.1 uncharacterized protein (TIGR02679 family) [Kutzneria kofuensis]